MSDQNPYRETFAGEVRSTGSSGPRPEVDVDPDAPEHDLHSSGAGSSGGLPRPGLGRDLPDDELASTVSGIGSAPGSDPADAGADPADVSADPADVAAVAGDEESAR